MHSQMRVVPTPEDAATGSLTCPRTCPVARATLRATATDARGRSLGMETQARRSLWVEVKITGLPRFQTFQTIHGKE